MQDASEECIPVALRLVREGKTVEQSIVSANVKTQFLDLILEETTICEADEIKRLFAGSSFLAEDLFSVTPSTTICDAISAVGRFTKVLWC